MFNFLDVDRGARRGLVTNATAARDGNGRSAHNTSQDPTSLFVKNDDTAAVTNAAHLNQPELAPNATAYDHRAQDVELSGLLRCERLSKCHTASGQQQQQLLRRISRPLPCPNA